MFSSKQCSLITSCPADVFKWMTQWLLFLTERFRDINPIPKFTKWDTMGVYLYIFTSLSKYVNLTIASSSYKQFIHHLVTLRHSKKTHQNLSLPICIHQCWLYLNRLFLNKKSRLKFIAQ